MGVTIHYRGKINDVKNVDVLTDEVVDFAQTLGWRSQRWDEDWSQPNTARVTHTEKGIKIEGHAPLRGVTLFPHKESEPLSLTFEPGGYLVHILGMVMIADGQLKPEESWMATKTQFAPIEAHISIIKLLQHLKKRYISNLEVEDEGGYWQTDDANELKRRIDSINRGLDILEAALSMSQKELSEAKSPEELAEMIERIFKEKLGG